jgi:hypothetical protein
VVALHVSKKIRRIGLVALAAIAGVVWHGRKLRRLRSTTHPEWPAEVRKFVRLLGSRGAALASVRREGLPTRRGWMVEWDTGTLFFPDEVGGDPL